MDAAEKRVMRWKRHLIASNVVWSEDVARALKQRHLVSDGVVLQIEPEANSFSRMSRYIELLLKDAAWYGAGSVNGDFVRTPFQSFCDVIENEGGQPWVAEELRTELKTERGDLIIEDYIRKESAQLVHRLYGGTKRLSELEKRRLESVFAVRTQCTKDVWKRNLESTQAKLDDARYTVRSYAADTVAAVRILQDAVRDQRKNLDGGSAGSGSGGSKVAFSSDHVVGYRAGRDSLPLFPDINRGSGGRRTGSGQSNDDGGGGRNVDDPDNRTGSGRSLLLQQPLRIESGSDSQRWDGVAGVQAITSALADAADQIRRMTDAWSAERDRLRAERSRALVNLGVRDGVSTGGGSAPQVDVELQATLQRLNAELSVAKERAADAEERVGALEDRLRTARSDIEDELRSKDRTISLLTASLERAEKEAEASNGESRDFKRQLHLVKAELARYSIKSRYLEKSRHLGYIRDSEDYIDAVDSVRRRDSLTWSNSPVVVARSPVDSNGSRADKHKATKPVWRSTNKNNAV